MERYKTGAKAEDARNELIEEMKGKWCPMANSNESTVECVGEGCAVFNEGNIVKHQLGETFYCIENKPHCGLVKRN